MAVNNLGTVPIQLSTGLTISEVNFIRNLGADADYNSANVVLMNRNNGGSAGQVLRVNSSGTGLEWVDISVGGGIGGTIDAGQVAFGTATNTIGGDNNFYWDNTNKRLGIKTNSPRSELEVVGNITLNSDSATRRIQKTIGGNIYPVIEFGSGDTKIIGTQRTILSSTGYGDYITFSPLGNTISISSSFPSAVVLTVKGVTSQTGDLQQWSVSSSVLAKLTKDGFLCLGDTTPSQKLTIVDGSIQLERTTSADQWLVYKPSGTLSSSNLQWNVGRLSGGSYVIRTWDGTSNVDRLLINSSGNVGIETSTPSYKLDVFSSNYNLLRIKRTTSGGVNFAIENSANQVIGITNVSGSFVNDIASGYNFDVRVDSSNIVFRVQSNGNVGIGTTSPQEKLDVVGNIKASGNLTIQGTANINTLTLTNALGISYGGTGLTSLGTSNQILGVNNGATGLEYKTLQGTANQINVVHSVGAITLSTPQDIATTSSPTFAGLTLNGNLNLTGNKLQNAIIQRNVKDITTTSYTAVLEDAYAIVRMNNTSANTFIIPASSSVNFPITTTLIVMKYGTGNTTIQGATGVTIRDPNNLATITTQYDMRTIMKIGTDEWTIQ